MQPELAWQTSLLDGGAVEVDATFATLRRLQLDERSWVDHAPGWLSGSETLFEDLLGAADWRQRSLWMYDRQVTEPRLTAGFTAGTAARTWTRDSLRSALREEVDDLVPGGDTGTSPASLPEPLATIAGVLSGRYEVEFDSVWVNLYRDGSDSVAWHGDRNARVLQDPLVVTLTLGARRRFQLRRKGTTSIAHEIEPGPGDLVVMGGACQHEWEHAVPKTKKPVGPRMSVTIRHSR